MPVPRRQIRILIVAGFLSRLPRYTKDGFEHEGQRYRSLTVIAERITGAHWSGPRFFGLTKNARASFSARAGQ